MEKEIRKQLQEHILLAEQSIALTKDIQRATALWEWGQCIASPAHCCRVCE